MGCPRCQCNEISASGMCLWCGYQVNTPASEPDSGSPKNNGVSASPDTGSLHTPDEPGREELPQWRQELSNRLQSIKKKREASRAQAKRGTGAISAEDAVPATVTEAEKPASKPEPVIRPRISARASRRRTSPNKDVQAEMPAPPEQQEFPVAEQPAPEPAIKPVQVKDAREIIDSMISRTPTQPEAPVNGASYPFQTVAALRSDEGRMILVHRFLSGLLDLMIMVASTAGLIVAADLFSGVRMLDLRDVIHYSVLFLLVYFLYSLLFLGFSNQTIGMMMMSLHVLGRDGKRPRFGQMLARNCLYLFSLLCIGIGLIWAFFDTDHQCLHDRLTHTRLTRIDAS